VRSAREQLRLPVVLMAPWRTERSAEVVTKLDEKRADECQRDRGCGGRTSSGSTNERKPVDDGVGRHDIAQSWRDKRRGGELSPAPLLPCPNSNGNANGEAAQDPALSFGINVRDPTDRPQAPTKKKSEGRKQTRP